MSRTLAQGLVVAACMLIANSAIGQNAPKTYEEAMAIIDSLQEDYVDNLRRVFGAPTVPTDPLNSERTKSHTSCWVDYQAARNEIAPLIELEDSGPVFAVPKTSGRGWASWVAAVGSGLLNEEYNWICWMNPPPEKEWWVTRFHKLYLKALLEELEKKDSTGRR